MQIDFNSPNFLQSFIRQTFYRQSFYYVVSTFMF